MEMVEGTPLHSMLRDPARRLETPIVPILTQVLEGLGYAHRLGITHRDVKPGNILVTPEGRAKIVDFGIARLAEGSMTQAGSMLGTPSYMSPEQVSEDDVAPICSRSGRSCTRRWSASRLSWAGTSATRFCDSPCPIPRRWSRWWPPGAGPSCRC
jgi:serine/threonine protein kinase